MGTAVVAHGARKPDQADKSHQHTPPPTIDDLPPEVQFLIVGRLNRARDLLALRAVSCAWRQLVTGKRGAVYTLCRPLLPDAAFALIKAQPHADTLLCFIYSTLAAARVSLHSMEPVEHDGAICWVPRVQGTLCGWGLSVGQTRTGDRTLLRAWSVGFWSNDVLVNGVARSADNACDIRGHKWRWRSPHTKLACWRCRNHATWTGQIVDGVQHGRGIWEVSRHPRCEHHDDPCNVRCAGRWTKGALACGTLTWADGHRYDGDFRDGLFDGYGILDTGHDARYVGYWANGQPNGNGILYDKGTRCSDDINSGGDAGVSSIYNGQWLCGAQCGVGTKEWTDGRHYVGTLAHNRPDGRGSFKYADGSRHDGEWDNGEPHGWGESFDTDGRLQRKGYWVRGRPCSRMTYRHYKETGHQKSTARCALSKIAQPFRDLVEWVDTPLINF